MISLGAAEYLAMADLTDRAGATPRLLGSGDMCSQSSDRGFTGGDAFFVVLATDSELHHYHVSAYGEVPTSAHPHRSATTSMTRRRTGLAATVTTTDERRNSTHTTSPPFRGHRNAQLRHAHPSVGAVVDGPCWLSGVEPSILGGAATDRGTVRPARGTNGYPPRAWRHDVAERSVVPHAPS